MHNLDTLYQELILDHSKHPHGQGEITSTDHEQATHHELNPSCGDEITLTIAYNRETDRVMELKWQGAGCSISTASASMLAQLVNEKQPTATEATALITEFRNMLQGRGNYAPNAELLEDTIALQGVSKFVMRIKCAMLGWVALEADLKQLGL